MEAMTKCHRQLIFLWSPELALVLVEVMTKCLRLLTFLVLREGK